MRRGRAAGSVREVLVVGLEEPEVDAVVLGSDRELVGPEQHAVGVRGDEPCGGPGLTAELGCPARDVDEEVRVPVEERRDRGQVLDVAPDVRADERRARVARDRCLEGVEQAPEHADALVGEGDRRVRSELLDPFVVDADGLEERHRIGGVHEHGKPEVAGGLPHRIQHRIVGEDPPSPARDREPEVLPDLEPPRTLLRRPFERLHERTGSGRGVEQPPVEMAERVEAARVRVVVTREVLVELGAPPPVEIDERNEVRRVHQRQQRADVGRHPARVGREPPAEMCVRVDRRKGGGRRRMGRQLERRGRIEGAEARSRARETAQPTQRGKRWAQQRPPPVRS